MITLDCKAKLSIQTNHGLNSEGVQGTQYIGLGLKLCINNHVAYAEENFHCIKFFLNYLHVLVTV